MTFDPLTHPAAGSPEWWARYAAMADAGTPIDKVAEIAKREDAQAAFFMNLTAVRQSPETRSCDGTKEVKP